jgi:hypothetical protein
MRQDILLDENKKLLVRNGDFVIGESDQQHIELILSTNPNDWKENPVVGAALIKSLGGNINGFVKRNVTVQLEADGYELEEIIEKENDIDVKARLF